MKKLKNKCAECYYDGVCDRTICKPLHPAFTEDGVPIEEPFDPWDGEPTEIEDLRRVEDDDPND